MTVKTALLIAVVMSLAFCVTAAGAGEEDAVHPKKGDILVYRHQSDTRDEHGDSEVWGWDATRRFRASRKIWESTSEAAEGAASGPADSGGEIGLRWSANTSVDYGYVEREDVTVPAGTFRNCSKTVHVTSDECTIAWWCPGVGLVKEERVRSSPLERETQELQEIRTR